MSEPAIVCFDTQVLIWGIKREAAPKQTGLIERSEYLIRQCEESDTKVIIPAIVLAELLSGTDRRLHGNVTQIVQKNFIVAPFDSQAAQKYAEMWNAQKHTRKKLQNEGFTRSELKADCMIAAIAIVRKAGCIYTRDRGLKNFAQDFIEIRDLPLMPPKNLSLAL